MSILLRLSTLALKGAARAAGETVGFAATGAGAEAAVQVLTGRFTDHSRPLTRALERASARAWRAAEISLAGRSWWDRCKVVLATADERAIREQVDAFLTANPLDGVDGFGPDFRAQCLTQLQAARKLGLLDRGKVEARDLAQRVGDLSRFGDQAAAVRAEFALLDEIAADLRGYGHEALATFITLRPGSGPPLLLSAMRYFFQRELEKDEVLFRGLAYARLESLAEGQQNGFASLGDALEEHGARLEALLADVQSVVVRTHADVLDIKAELARQGQQMHELGQAVLKALAAHQLERRELRASDSLSIRDEGERRLVRDLVKRYRSLPAEQRKRMPALLNAVGKLEVAAGEFEAAEKDFRELGTIVADAAARGEAAHNAYRAALERRAWDEALAALAEAAEADPVRFSPFPADKYQPERILGAGGFGVAFLCRNRHSGGRVVIKTLRREGLGRDLSEVFREAQTLEELEHPAIIRIRDCDYADQARTRPFFVMDYFAGQTLAEYVETHGTLSPAEFLPLARTVCGGMERAHSRAILHRDLKPANVLVRKDAAGWQVRLIDFGLALKAESGPSTTRASLDRTLAGSSIAGTIEYAAPEQMGKLKGVATGPYSDVYGFGKTCCFALFGTPQPTFQHWQRLPAGLADLIGRCLAEQPGARPQNFTEVLRELERLDRPAPRKPLEAVPVPEMTARPVVDVLEVVEPSRPTVLERQREREREPARSRPVRQEMRDEPERRRGGSPWLGILTLCLLAPLVLCGTGWGLMFFGVLGLRGGGGVGGVPPPPDGRPGNPFGTRSQFRAAEGQPVAPEEFPKILEELKKEGTTLDRRGEIANRLAAAAPTEKQKETHRRLKLKAGLKDDRAPKFKPGTPVPPQDVDEIQEVSLALNPLLQDDNRQYKKAGALACLKGWGTPANVDHLTAMLAKDFNEHGVFDVRVTAVKALGAIGDPKCIPAVAGRLADGWDGPRGVVEVLISFGPAAEQAVIPYLKDHFARARAIQVLAKIGGKDSVAALKEIVDGRSPFNKKEAAGAIVEILQREK